MFEWPHGAPSSAVVSDFMEKLAQDEEIHGPRQESLAECEGSCKGSSNFCVPLWTRWLPLRGPNGFPQRR